MAAVESAADFADLEILVVARRDEHGEVLIRELQRTRARVRHVWPVPAAIETPVDAIFGDATAEMLRAVPWVPGEPKAALVLLADHATSLDLVRQATPDAVLHRPFAPAAILAGLTVARANFSYIRRLRHRIDKLDETSRTIRSVERAKTMLMTSRKMREDEAYRFIRSQAMARRVTIGTLATALLDSADVLGWELPA